MLFKENWTRVCFPRSILMQGVSSKGMQSAGEAYQITGRRFHGNYTGHFCFLLFLTLYFISLVPLWKIFSVLCHVTHTSFWTKPRISPCFFHRENVHAAKLILAFGKQSHRGRAAVDVGEKKKRYMAGFRESQTPQPFALSFRSKRTKVNFGIVPAPFATLWNIPTRLGNFIKPLGRHNAIRDTKLQQL